ncbi:dihydrofolate reductase-like domain-containing protein [Microdochium bolleyi]|uniref:2,5-diamino-6-ribosylamino-4(3H)-pyrimidinone 5'-phosphate reductase n=1 Tax=Microdochium bolleyi TaxID=196109 RepID=A0A136J510_9PEZI|nr:dihydrofolate reductase-like domain-containing protein [Microdochium bolleyi]
MASTLEFPAAEADLLEPHLPPLETPAFSESQTAFPARPFVTLTFATSLDSALSLGPGIRTTLSGPQSKAMTHYLRSRHDAICIGVGTAIADDPGLNCRLDAASRRRGPHSATPRSTSSPHPRPIIIDPRLRWDFTRENKIFQLVRAGNGLAPYIITTVAAPPQDKAQILEEHGGKFIVLDNNNSSDNDKSPEAPQTTTVGYLDWDLILAAIQAEGLRSVMIEGGGAVINSLLLVSRGGSSRRNHLIDSVIVTIAPTWLGKGSVVVSPDQERDRETGAPLAGPRLAGVRWIPLGEDVVLCGRIQ